MGYGEKSLLKAAFIEKHSDPAHNQASDLKCDASSDRQCVDRGLLSTFCNTVYPPKWLIISQKKDENDRFEY